MRIRALLPLLFLLCAIGAPRSAGSQVASSTDVTRATLDNGMQVVILRDPIAPVVSTVMNYRVGANDEPIAGLAHAQEHMMFRGSQTLSAAQLAKATVLTGGTFGSDVTNELTQFYFTVPSGKLDVALHLAASRAQGLLNAQDLWDRERPEVAGEIETDNSSATYRLHSNVLRNVLAGTPYAEDGLGTLQSIGHDVNAPQLQAFYEKWYRPNNAVYVISGNVDPQATLAKVKALFGSIPAGPVAPRRTVELSRFDPKVYHERRPSGNTEALQAYRFPGYESPDWAASKILIDILNNERGDLFDFVARGYALRISAEARHHAKAGIAFINVELRNTVPPAQGWVMVRSVINGYLQHGVPERLVRAGKERERAQNAFARNSISRLAAMWSHAVAVENRTPDEDLALIDRVTVEDVNRVLHDSFEPAPALGFITPKDPNARGTRDGGKAPEKIAILPIGAETLPSWAQQGVSDFHLPTQTAGATMTTLSNGIQLIVQPEPAANTIVVRGQVYSDPGVQAQAGKDGVASLCRELLSYGTTSYDRVGYVRELDKVVASASLGSTFSLAVTSQHFNRGMQLLADGELHPAFDPKSFALVKDRAYEEARNAKASPDFLAMSGMVKALYPEGDPARRRATPASVDSLTLSNVKEWYAETYRPDVTTIVIVGDVTPDRAQSVVDRWFGEWAARGPKPTIQLPPVPISQSSIVVVSAKDRPQDTILLAQTLGLTRDDPDATPLQLANAVLTGDFPGSALFRDLRQATGSAYDVESQLDIGRTRSSLTITYGSAPANSRTAEGLILDHIRRLQTGTLSSEQLQQAKALLLATISIQAESYSGIAAQLLDYGIRALPLDENLIEARRLVATTAEQVRAAVVKWIRPDDFVRVVEGPGSRTPR